MFRDAPRPATADNQAPTATSLTTGWLSTETTYPHQCIALCGSRTSHTDQTAISSFVRTLGSLLSYHCYQVIHGPVGIGIEVMTYIADHYRPPGLTFFPSRLGHANVVKDAELVLVIGGGTGTQDEADLALAMGKKVLPAPSTGGTAMDIYARMRGDVGLRAWISDAAFTELHNADATHYVKLMHDLTHTDSGEP